MPDPRDEVRPFSAALYPLGLLLSIVPLVDVVARAWPFRLDAPEWRFAAFGTLFGSLGTVLLGLALLGVVAAYRGNGALLRVVSVLAFLGGVVALVLLALFGLDALQVRQMAPETIRRSITTSAISAATAGLLGAVSLLSVGVGAWASSRGGWRSGRRGGRPAAPNPIVVQSSVTSGKIK